MWHELRNLACCGPPPCAGNTGEPPEYVHSTHRGATHHRIRAFVAAVSPLAFLPVALESRPRLGGRNQSAPARGGHAPALERSRENRAQRERGSARDRRRFGARAE